MHDVTVRGLGEYSHERRMTILMAYIQRSALGNILWHCYGRFVSSICKNLLFGTTEHSRWQCLYSTRSELFYIPTLSRHLGPMYSLREKMRLSCLAHNHSAHVKLHNLPVYIKNNHKISWLRNFTKIDRYWKSFHWDTRQYVYNKGVTTDLSTSKVSRH